MERKHKANSSVMDEVLILDENSPTRDTLEDESKSPTKALPSPVTYKIMTLIDQVQSSKALHQLQNSSKSQAFRGR